MFRVLSHKMIFLQFYRTLILLLIQRFNLLRFYRATQLCYRGLGSRNSVCLSVCLSVRLSATRVLCD